MATLRAFRALRFDEAAGPLADIVAPPYDVISATEREALAAKNPHNVVHLTLPEQKADDRSKFVKYARSAAQLEEWRRDGTLQLEDSPSLYRYTQAFEVPGTGKRLTRTTLISLIKVEPYANGVVLPHEQTFPKHKEDRLRILEATRSHLECIFGLFEDDGGALHGLIASAPAARIGEIRTEDGIEHTLDRISDGAAIAAVIDDMAGKKVWIADGHHRYETALAFRAMQGEKDGLIAEDFMMMALCSISDPGLVLLPTHRILKSMTTDAQGLLARLQEHFSVERLPNTSLMSRIEELAKNGRTRAFGVALPGGLGAVAITDEIDALAREIAGAGSDELKRLDVSVLHGFIFEKLLGLAGLDFFGYTRIEREAIEAVESGSPAAFLMNPPTVEDMKVIAAAGDFMPQKSTYYYPKLLSGMLVWSLKDFDA